MTDPTADLALTAADRDDLTSEITTVFREHDAVRLLRLVGLDRRSLPEFQRGDHVRDWAAAFRAIDDGALATPTPYRDLLRAALRRFPGNAVFLRIELIYTRGEDRPHVGPPPSPTARRVHVVQASPNDQNRLRSELKAIRAAAAPGHLVVTDSPDAGLLDLRAVLEFRPDILHVSGHGERGRLLFEDTYGETDAVPAARVVELLTTYRGAAGVRLSGIVLNSCDSGAVADLFRPVAGAVIAYEGPLDDACAVAFAAELYATLRTVPDLVDAAAVAAEHVRDGCPAIARNLVRLGGTG